jgi:5-methylcytosine-specific restriction endonuclease McrA
MTEAQFTTFVKGHLRKASRWWKPISNTLKKARVSRGHYLCNGCKQIVPNSFVHDGKRKKGIFVDHVNPVINPLTGFTTWDDFINRLFCEEDNLQLLCYTCHNTKTAEERRTQKDLNE